MKWDEEGLSFITGPMISFPFVQLPSDSRYLSSVPCLSRNELLLTSFYHPLCLFPTSPRTEFIAVEWPGLEESFTVFLPTVALDYLEFPHFPTWCVQRLRRLCLNLFHSVAVDRKYNTQEKWSSASYWGMQPRVNAAMHSGLMEALGVCVGGGVCHLQDSLSGLQKVVCM